MAWPKLFPIELSLKAGPYRVQFHMRAWHWSDHYAPGAWHCAEDYSRDIWVHDLYLYWWIFSVSFQWPLQVPEGLDRFETRQYLSRTHDWDRQPLWAPAIYYHSEED